MSKINYDLSLIKGIAFDVDGVLSPSTIPMAEDGTPKRMVNVKDGYALKYAVQQGMKISIISGASGDALVKRFNALGITDVYLKVGTKLDRLKQWIADNSLSPEEVAFVGDDVPDFECMEYVGLSVAPADAVSDIKEIARYVSPVNGGYGVARDLLEELLRSRGMWKMGAKAFGW